MPVVPVVGNTIGPLVTTEMAAKKHYVFTFHNYGTADLALLSGRDMEGVFAALVVQTETASTGAKHLQGYLKLKTKLRMNNLKDLLKEKLSADWDSVHLEPCRSPTHAIEYCRKHDTFNGEFRHEFGVPPNGVFHSMFAMPQDDNSVWFWMPQMFEGYNNMLVQH